MKKDIREGLPRGTTLVFRGTPDNPEWHDEPSEDIAAQAILLFVKDLAEACKDGKIPQQLDIGFIEYAAAQYIEANFHLEAER